MPKSFGSLPKDQNYEAIQSGTGIQTSDATTIAKNSPLAYTNAVITLTVPSNAAEVVFKPSTDMRVSELVGMGTYYVVAANTTQAFPLSRTDSIFITRDAADGTLNFYFVLVKND